MHDHDFNLPINSLPHMCSNVGHSVRVAQIICKRTAAKDGEKDAERYFHNKSDNDRRQCGSDDG